VVDLDGARRGLIRTEVIGCLIEAAGPAEVQASGGIRSPADAARLLAAGAARVVVGTAALAEPGALEQFATELGDQLVVAIDVRGGQAAVRGWLDDTGFEAGDVARRCAEASVPRILCTAIERDGMLGGPDLDLLREVREVSGLPVLAAGGISSEADFAAVAAIDDAMERPRFGAPGARIVTAERLKGEELSFFALCAGEHAIAPGLVQDHQAAFAGDRRHNTGRQVAYQLVPHFGPRVEARVSSPRLAMTRLMLTDSAEPELEPSEAERVVS